jgi:hypothetical protein
MDLRGRTESNGLLHASPSPAQLRKLLAVIGVLFVIAVCAASAGASMVKGSSGYADCSWGASSITASYENGQVVESQPETSGCTSPEPGATSPVPGADVGGSH